MPGKHAYVTAMFEIDEADALKDVNDTVSTLSRGLMEMGAVRLERRDVFAELESLQSSVNRLRELFHVLQLKGKSDWPSDSD